MLKYKMLEIKQLVKNLEELHSTLDIYANNNQNDFIIENLTNGQETMIKIDEIIETSEGDNVPYLHDMEQYCEVIYLLSQNLLDKNQWIKYLDDLKVAFHNIQKGIDALQIKKEIVFFPYKASMWDSLESIWKAASNDSECVAYVVPIPYFERNEQGKFVTEKYEINKFPSYVPVIDYRDYVVSIRKPDIAYIHNPFDQYNKVTSVHPDYYSVELKKYVKKLVYVPYFVSFNAVSYSHRDLPCYYRVDYIVVESEKMIESFAPTIPLEKFVPMGSPIVDRILNLDKNKPEIPQEWKAMLRNGKDFGGKTVVMYNTSLSMMMREKEHFLDKIEAMTDSFSENKDIFVVWRPHPLMHATLQTLGDSYYRRFCELEKKFVENKIGVLDHTADVGVAIALCDAYVGEEASSIVNMFGIAGKPIFYCSIKIFEDRDLAEVTSFGNYIYEGWAYFVAEQNRLLCRKNMNNGIVEVLGNIPDTERYPYEAYRDIYVDAQNVYIQPYSGQGLCIYNKNEKSFTKSYVIGSIAYAFERMIYNSGKLRFIPEKYESVVEYEIETGNFIYEDLEEDEKSSYEERSVWHYTLPLWDVQNARAYRMKEKTQGMSIVFESEKISLKDFLFYITVDGLHIKENAQKPYRQLISNFDGTCGQKVHEYIKNSL